MYVVGAVWLFGDRVVEIARKKADAAAARHWLEEFGLHQEKPGLCPFYVRNRLCWGDLLLGSSASAEGFGSSVMYGPAVINFWSRASSRPPRGAAMADDCVQEATGSHV